MQLNVAHPQYTVPPTPPPPLRLAPRTFCLPHAPPCRTFLLWLLLCPLRTWIVDTGTRCGASYPVQFRLPVQHTTLPAACLFPFRHTMAGPHTLLPRWFAVTYATRLYCADTPPRAVTAPCITTQAPRWRHLPPACWQPVTRWYGLHYRIIREHACLTQTLPTTCGPRYPPHLLPRFRGFTLTIAIRWWRCLFDTRKKPRPSCR